MAIFGQNLNIPQVTIIAIRYLWHKKDTARSAMSFFMPATGIEPVREYKSRRILSPVRLPVPPRRLNGRRWIRTTEAICSRFTVCPLWPLGNPSIYSVSLFRTACHYISRNIKMQVLLEPYVKPQKHLHLLSFSLQYNSRNLRHRNKELIILHSVNLRF